MIPYWRSHIQKVHFTTKCPQSFNFAKRKHKFSAGVVAILLSQGFQQHKANRAIQGEGKTLAAADGSLEYFQAEPLLPSKCLSREDSSTH